ncbi:hypothetical protein [Clostridium perfringens]|uniref:hypothetical protein n=1 Tax=Clostridium perfringens TaxID=1502 RepID=UPI0039ECF1C6
MKKLINMKECFKILVIYFIVTIVNMKVVGFFVKDDTLKFYLRNYLWVLIIFTILFLILIRMFKVKFKSVSIFLGIIMLLLLFILLNLDFFTLGGGNTPEGGIFPMMTFLAFYTTLPFQTVIRILDGYDISNLSYIAVPIYMLLLWGFSYLIIKKLRD